MLDVYWFSFILCAIALKIQFHAAKKASFTPTPLHYKAALIGV